MQQFFITGTDTEVGKTHITRLLLLASKKAGYSCVGYKPVSAGCTKENGQWVNEDALMMQQNSSLQVPLSLINPFAFEPAIAPHIAAKEAGVVLNATGIAEGLADLREFQPDVLLMEGAGGWRLPLGNGEFLSDAVRILELEVIVVVGMRLGCLNHALLTVEAIERDGLKIKGWIANQISPDMPYYQQNIATLKQLINAPLLAEVPYGTQPEEATLTRLTDIFSQHIS